MSLELASKFKKYHTENPHIYEAFEKLTLEIISAGRRNFEVRGIIGKLRWDSAIRGNDEFKVNENYATYYGRLFEDLHPQHVGFFRKKNILPDDFCLLDFIRGV